MSEIRANRVVRELLLKQIALIVDTVLL